jgi:hypothetical protein
MSWIRSFLGYAPPTHTEAHPTPTQAHPTPTQAASNTHTPKPFSNELMQNLYDWVLQKKSYKTNQSKLNDIEKALIKAAYEYFNVNNSTIRQLIYSPLRNEYNPNLFTALYNWYEYQKAKKNEDRHNKHASTVFTYDRYATFATLDRDTPLYESFEKYKNNESGSAKRVFRRGVGIGGKRRKTFRRKNKRRHTRKH